MKIIKIRQRQGTNPNEKATNLSFCHSFRNYISYNRKAFSMFHFGNMINSGAEVRKSQNRNKKRPKVP